MLSTKDVNIGGEGSGMPKVITPGNHKVKVNKLQLKQYSFMEKDNGYYLQLEVETEPLDNFEGFFIDKDDESLGRYAGQIGTVKANQYYYKDTTLPSGTEINRDMEILKFIKNLCKETDCLSWFEKDADGKFDTIEEFVQGFSSEAPFKDKWLDVCVGGKEYYKNNGYIGYDMHFVKYKKGVKGFAKAGSTNVHVYNEDDHLKKADPPSNVDNFNNKDNGLSNSGDSFFETPEFNI
jgi:hypothetical protein